MSESDKHIDLFTPTGCLTTSALKGYSYDKLTAMQKGKVDKHLNSCEMCSDALEGIKLLSDPQKLDNIVSEINENLKSHLTQSQPQKDKAQNRLFYYVAAASVIILIGLYFYLQNSLDPDSDPQSISQVVEMEKRNIPPMPVAKTQESGALVESTPKSDQSIEQEVPNQVIVKKEKGERIEAVQKDPMIITEEHVDDVAPLKTLRAPERIPKSLASEETELDAEETIIVEEYIALDIASTQPIEYYIGGIVVYDEIYDEADQARITTASNGFNEKAARSEKMNVAPQMSASSSKKGKGDRRKENDVLFQEDETAFTEDAQNENHFFSLGNEVPQFPGGYEALIIFLNTNLEYPKEAKEQGLQGQLVISFMVEESGEISSVTIVRGIGGGCDEEAIRVIESMPDWEPAIIDGNPVKVLFNMPITFRLH